MDLQNLGFRVWRRVAEGIEWWRHVVMYSWDIANQILNHNIWFQPTSKYYSAIDEFVLMGVTGC